MNQSLLWCFVSLALVLGNAFPTLAVDFENDVAPILAEHCLRCHRPGNAKGDLSLETDQQLRDSEFVIGGDADSSHLVSLITAAEGETPEMPAEGKPLSSQQVKLIRDWVNEGASWPDGFRLQQRTKADADWWAFQPLRVDPDTSLDELIDRRLGETDLSRNPTADRHQLIRRVTFDLIGLPPTPEEIDAFVNDPAPDAYEHLIDRLLASPHYGERWGRHWLDVIRFGESNGFERNVLINNLWPFRDYVIRSLNEDKPFNQLIREHLAGDVLEPNEPDVVIGSAFLVAGPYDDVGNQDAVQAAQIRANTIDEMIRSSSEAFLGLTIGCARCHDHKFDPIKQDDYYSLYSTFAGTVHGDEVWATPSERQAHHDKSQPLHQQVASLEKQLRDLDDAIKQRESESANPITDQESKQRDEWKKQLDQVRQQLSQIPALPRAWLGRHDANRAKGPFHVFLGGSPQKPGEIVTTQSLVAMSTSDDQHEPSCASIAYSLSGDASESERRLAFANWVTDSQNPLTLRVLANRLWHYHFGTGIVATPSDFGYMGERPSHPELLDFLATQLRDHGWRIKPMHKLIMMSQTYRQSASFNADAAAMDADDRLLWRFPPQRLSAEAIRDSMLQLSGVWRRESILPRDDTSVSLQTESAVPSGGPGFRLYQFMQDNVCTYVPLDQHGPETYRRAVYHQNARASVVDLMTDFDQPDCAFGTPRRSETTTPLQALTMLNHSFTLDMSQAMATRLAKASDQVSDQVDLAYRGAFSRKPDDEERADCVSFIEQHGLAAFCRALLNASELIYVQ